MSLEAKEAAAAQQESRTKPEATNGIIGLINEGKPLNVDQVIQISSKINVLHQTPGVEQFVRLRNNTPEIADFLNPAFLDPNIFPNSVATNPDVMQDIEEHMNVGSISAILTLYTEDQITVERIMLMYWSELLREYSKHYARATVKHQ